jgi:hypothetical protein
MPALGIVCRFSLATVLLLPSLLLAQQPGNPNPGDAIAQQLLSKEVHSDLTDPSLSSVARIPKLQAILSATSSKTQAALEIGLKSSEAFSGSVKIAGPLSKQDTDTKLASLTGLTDQASITLGVHFLHPNPVTRAFQVESGKFLDLLCAAWLMDHPGEECPDENSKKDISTNDLSPRARRSVLLGLGLGGGVGLFSAEATYGAPKTFDFLTSGLFTKDKQRHSAVSVAASAGWLPLRPGFYFVALTYRYERSFTSSAVQDICLPLGSAGASRCQSSPVGPPQREISNIAQIEVRKYFDGGALAVNPRFSRDFKQKISGFELPFYFLKDEKGTLNGGLTAGWRSDTKSVTVTAFLGTMSDPLGSGNGAK